MRPFVRTGIALLLAAGLGAYIYFVELKKPKDKEEKKKEKVFAIVKAKVKTLQLAPAAGEALRVEKDGDKWRLTAPVQVAADANEVDSLLTTLENLELEEVVVESPTELKQFGLEIPKDTVTLTQDGAPAASALLIGEKTPDGASLYAKTPDKPRVFTITSWQGASFEKKPFDLRDRDLLKVKRDAVKALEIQGKNESYALERSDSGEWSFTRPLRTLAGRWSVDALLGTLESLRMESVATEQAKEPKELAKLGLDKPQRVLRLTLADGGYKVLEIGGSPSEKKYYAREASSPLVAVIPNAIVDDLAKGMKELRAKRLADVASFDVTGIELESEGKKSVLLRSSAKDGSGVEQQSWKKTATDKKDLDKAKVEDALFKLSGLEVQEFLDQPQASASYGFEPPLAQVTLELQGGKPKVRIELGRKDGAYYSRRPGDDAVLKLDAAKVEEALKALKEL
jgi:hypothetical protein